MLLQVAALAEALEADVALVWLLAVVLAKVVEEVTALVERRLAVVEQAVVSELVLFGVGFVGPLDPKPVAWHFEEHLR